MSSSGEPFGTGPVAIIGHGFIGGRVAEVASDAGLAVSVLSRRDRAVPQGVKVILGDAASHGDLERVLAGAEHVVFAAGTSVPAAAQHRVVDQLHNNLEPLLATLESLAEFGVPRFTYLSSGGTVYGPMDGTATELTPEWPIATYGVLKMTAERFVAMHARLAGFHADILRCSNVYGPGQPTDGSQGIIGAVLSRLERGEPVTVFGDGSASRDFLHIDDLANVILRLAPSQHGVRVLNVGAGETVPVIDVIRRVAELLDVEPRIEYQDHRPFDVKSLELDITELRKVLDFQPRALQVGLASLLLSASSR